ncbi:MAG: DMT family transporter [Actinobacteria bacterium]|nr:DMT family transporter [Actinomycetota bacterium]
MSSNQQQSLARVAPAIFVALWSTGFVVARYATTDAGPLTFLCVRMFLASGLLWLIATALHAPRMARSDWSAATIVGVFMHAIYLGGVFVAINLGLPSGLSALIAGLHPVATSVAARVFLREQLSRKQIVGVTLGLVGVCAVVVEKLEAVDGGVTTGAMIAMMVSILGLTVGTLVQRAFGKEMPLLRGTATQYLASGVVLAVASGLSESWKFEITRNTVFSMLWAVIVLSLGAVLLMMTLLARHTAARVSSLFFLTPALSTIEGAILFDERLGALALAGLVIAIFGVRLTMQTAATTPDASTAAAPDASTA